MLYENHGSADCVSVGDGEVTRFAAALLACCLPSVAWAVCPTTPSDCPGPTYKQVTIDGTPGTLTTRGAINRTIFAAKDVTADGVTSDDVALAAAVTACGAAGGMLVLPPGQIKLTGATTITLRNCGIVGAQVPAGLSGQTGSYGTTILLTSTSVQPFQAASNWSISGVNFYWPNQTTGTTVYPPLIVPVTNAQFDWFMDHVNIINAYDGITVTGGRFYISDSTFYACNDMIKSSSIGDQWKLTSIHWSPGPWNKITGGANAAALLTCSAQNTMIHLTGPTNNMMIANSAAFAWKNGFLLDATATIGISDINLSLDYVGTFIDASSGGTWSQTIPVRMSGDCQINGAAVQNSTCFKFASTDGLWLIDSNIAAPGTLFTSTGASLRMDNSWASQIGFANDGAEYYGVNVTATAGGTVLNITNSVFSGKSGSTHSHGIATTPAISRLVLQNNQFGLLNDAVTAPAAAGTTLVQGNWSFTTQGTASLVLSGTNSVSYGTNFWDKPPAATLGACGGAGAAITGGVVGRITVGATNPTTSCDFTMPFVTSGIASGNCTAQDVTNGVVLTLSPAGSPATWTISSGATDIHGHLIAYRCQGAM